MKKYITRIIAMLILASVIGSVTSCSVEYSERHHHYDRDHDRGDYHHDRDEDYH